jgi:hypothetical protein
MPPTVQAWSVELESAVRHNIPRCATSVAISKRRWFLTSRGSRSFSSEAIANDSDVYTAIDRSVCSCCDRLLERRQQLQCERFEMIDIFVGVLFLLPELHRVCPHTCKRRSSRKTAPKLEPNSTKLREVLALSGRKAGLWRTKLRQKPLGRQRMAGCLATDLLGCYEEEVEVIYEQKPSSSLITIRKLRLNVALQALQDCQGLTLLDGS